MYDPVVIVSTARTPIGSFQGTLSSLTVAEIASAAIQSAVQRAGIEAESVQEVLMGHVLTAGAGQGPARQAVLLAGLPQSALCSGISKVCGSGMKSVMLAHDLLALETNDVMIAGGMESMSNAPYLLDKARDGYRLGHGRMIDHMFFDGLEDAYFDKGKLMGVFAEKCASFYHFSRQQQDEFAITSLNRANKAIQQGSFKNEISAITTPAGVFDTDEQPAKARPEKISNLRPAFSKDGTVTAANSSSISDGAAAIVLMRASTADSLGLKPKAKICAHASFAGEPCWFTTAPVFAMQKILKQLNWSQHDVDLWEINEAFAVVTLAAMTEMNLNPDKVNVHGGACALGHPIGASGTRILVTLLAALEKYDLKRGIASLCIGGGEATAMAIERI